MKTWSRLETNTYPTRRGKVRIGIGNNSTSDDCLKICLQTIASHQFTPALPRTIQDSILKLLSFTIAMAAQTAEGLTPEQLAFFNENGYLLIPDALSQDTVKELLADANQMLNDFSLDDHPMTKFSTGGDDGANHVGDKYFLESGDKIRFFFEEGR